MADKTIGQLPSASYINDNDKLVMEQGGSAVSVNGRLLKSMVGSIVLKGHVASTSALPANPSVGDAWSVGASAPYDVYIYGNGEWTNYGTMGVSSSLLSTKQDVSNIVGHQNGFDSSASKYPSTQYVDEHYARTAMTIDTDTPTSSICVLPSGWYNMYVSSNNVEFPVKDCFYMIHVDSTIKTGFDSAASAYGIATAYNYSNRNLPRLRTTFRAGSIVDLWIPDCITVWINSTANTDPFAPQTIQTEFDVRTYDEFFIVFGHQNGFLLQQVARCCTPKEIGNDQPSFGIFKCIFTYLDNGVVKGVQRTFTSGFNDNMKLKIEFENAYSADGADNSKCIPMRIYARKY